MGHEILYCLECKTRLRGPDFDQGKAFRLDNLAYCSGCTSVALKSLPPDKVARLLKEIATARKGRESEAPARPSMGGSSTPRAFSAAPPAPNRALHAGIAIGGLAVTVVALAFALVKGGGAPAVPRTARPAENATAAPRGEPPPPRTSDPAPARLEPESPRPRVAQAPPVPPEPVVNRKPEPAGAVSLFNGTDLSGWKQLKGLSDVREGALRMNVDGESATLLRLGSFSSYEATFRVSALPMKLPKVLFEVFVDTEANTFAFRLGRTPEWSEVKVNVRESRAEVWLNGVRLEPEKLKTEIRVPKTFGFFVKGGSALFKDVLLRSLD